MSKEKIEAIPDEVDRALLRYEGFCENVVLDLLRLSELGLFREAIRLKRRKF